MSAETKAKAKDKLANFIVKIGYPDKWKDYSGLQVCDSLSLYENMGNISEFFLLDQLKPLQPSCSRRSSIRMLTMR